LIRARTIFKARGIADRRQVDALEKIIAELRKEQKDDA